MNILKNTFLVYIRILIEDLTYYVELFELMKNSCNLPV